MVPVLALRYPEPGDAQPLREVPEAAGQVSDEAVAALARALQTMTEETPGSLASCDMENGEEAIVLTASALLDSMPHADRLAIAGITEERLADAFHAKVCGPFTTVDPLECVYGRQRDVLLGRAILAALSAGSATPAPEASREEGGA